MAKGAGKHLRPGYCLTLLSQASRKFQGYCLTLLSEASRKSPGQRLADGQGRREAFKARLLRREAFKARLLPNLAF